MSGTLALVNSIVRDELAPLIERAETAGAELEVRDHGFSVMIWYKRCGRWLRYQMRAERDDGYDGAKTMRPEALDEWIADIDRRDARLATASLAAPRPESPSARS